ncbi:hypothetical protein GCM10011321_25720 [Youhaiella tibetensis]|uniref:Uncharacterized protein n=1 Tax=Paradevosia tibetensis TaxID=1447062 RepID=A0A5B9DJS0_9HYPH|nr:ATP-binding protein [Youhaiella tibetensis]QEE19414.1 hypothetical protein FNA67_04150 [Youhaiella tibetensis]GGF33399.1 hypothetical protein GCM10011321_25720 [Youhaiella tibetensis]
MADNVAAGDGLPEDEIDVTPTRALFVDMLTRDIQLTRAVIDLVDNCIDGARRLRPGTDDSLEGLFVDLTLNGDQFIIHDNCGGIPIDTARHYAFRFGRPKGHEATPNSVGQFGVGMKRALFKFGHKFEVVSTTTSEHFELRVDVDKWVEETGAWRFQFDSNDTGLNNPIEKTGTTITVKPLRANVASQFALEYFQNSLAREIQAAQQQYIDRKMRISFNGKGLIATAWRLASGGGIEPLYIDDVVPTPGGNVHRRIFAGVAESSPQAAGWYVFCNGRMILEADQSPATGWQTSGDEGVTIPKYHGQYARFRGYVFLDAADASLLPWNTTKTGVDSDSAIWRNTFTQMQLATRPVIDFLNRLDSENDNEEEGERYLTAALRQAPPKSIRAVAKRETFTWPQLPPRPKAPPVSVVQFRRPKDKVDALRKELDVSSNKQLGEVLFDAAYSKHLGE